jgi:hypothetical protein
MKIKTLFTGFIAVLAFAGAAYAGTVSDAVQQAVKNGVPSDQVSLIVNRAKAAGVPDAAITGMLQVIVRAKQDNVPVGLITGKIIEGISKHVAPQMIVGAADRFEHAYTTADRVYSGMNIKGNTTGEFKEAMAIAVFNGVKPDQLKDLYHAAPGAGASYYIMGTVSLTSLIASGYSTEQSLSFMKREFTEHKNTDQIQHETMKLMEQPMGNRNNMMERGMGQGNTMQMNRTEMPNSPSDRMPMNQDMNMHNQRN